MLHMELSKLSTPLKANEIEFRVQSINKGGYATILAYKDARVDMQRLDDVCTPLGWKREHCRDNKNCIVSIWDENKKQWVSKEDTGTESNAEAEKGLASDSFKRACFNWGIGRELYDYPLIQIKLNGDGKNNKDEWFIHTDKGRDYPKAGWGLKLKSWVWFNQFDDENNLIYLGAKDEKGVLRFN